MSKMDIKLENMSYQEFKKYCSDREEGIDMLKAAGIKVFKYEKDKCLMRRL